MDNKNNILSVELPADVAMAYEQDFYHICSSLFL